MYISLDEQHPVLPNISNQLILLTEDNVIVNTEEPIEEPP
ncbi:hypothetical protein GPAL_0422 [Glaciecola pallidula DSM 14239 = ACAM 615]|uniref:Uncharacterized protein n=1 Tax=Brumicola pallidula DSM 14239 = ACAM 615 TaxID=1121922 RepID=K6ZAE2_9ALTE|nr:hypothetical protein GPAL_0422 [Glaciecola pallidula DSM 14239 = ACAM 615]